MYFVNSQILFLFVNAIHFTVGQLAIARIPAIIEAEITKSLTVTCNFLPQSSDGYQVFSLAIEKRTSNSNFEQLAIIDIDSHKTVHIEAPSYGIHRSSGVISSTHGSFLTVEWIDPKVSESGTYQCKANVFSQADDIFVFHESETVTFQQPTVNSVLHLIKDLENKMNNLLQGIEDEFNNITAKKNETHEKLQKLENGIHGLELAEFKISTVFNGHRYYLSLYQPHSADNSEMVCEILGGYLAEVGSQEEMDFISSLIGAPSAANISFLVGGTDAQHEGNWIYRHSGTPLNYSAFSPGEPNNWNNDDMAENCQSILYIYYRSMFQMNDVFCFNSNLETFKLYFICEVPL